MVKDMELRHLKYFIAVAEELHFARAANRLHIDSSALSRAIKELESDLRVQLFCRDTRKTNITSAGILFLEEARRLFALLEQARARVRAVAQGTSGTLRIGYSDGLAQSLLAELIAQFRDDEPDVDLHILEMPFAEQAKSLRAGLLDIGLALTAFVGDRVSTEPLWRDPLVAVLPAKHPLTRRRSIALADMASEPLVLCHPDCGSGCHGQIDAVLRRVIRQPRVAKYAATAAAGVTLVAAGFGIAFMGAGEVAMFQRTDVAIRPVRDPHAVLTTYLMRSQAEPSGAVLRFIGRLQAVRERDQPVPGQD
jgi:DNA-binding transcriptional LysR family regulator